MISVVYIHNYFTSEAYRKFNFKISYNRREFMRQTTKNCPTNNDEYTSLSPIYCCHNVRAESLSALCYVLQESVLWADIEKYTGIIKTITVCAIGAATMFPVV
jgi:hypothetical protein